MSLSLTPISEKHVELVREWACREDLAEYFRRCPPAFVWAATTESVLKSCTGSYIISVDDEPLGMFCLFNWDNQNKKIEFGVLVDKTRTSSKRGPIAVQAGIHALDYAFNYLGCERVYCFMLEHRTASHQLLESWGFQKEGLLRNHCYWNGTFHNEVILSMTSEDFKKVPR